MRKREFAIDINRLNSDQLKQLAAMFYEQDKLNEVKEINERIAFLCGWMDEEQEKEHVKRFC